MALVRLLVVDDFRLWRDCLKEHLEGHPDLHIAGFASDGLEALQKAEEIQPDLVLLDISLPKLSGIEAARQIRKVNPNCKILFLTGYSYPEMVRGALEVGGCAYVHKDRRCEGAAGRARGRRCRATVSEQQRNGSQ